VGPLTAGRHLEPGSPLFGAAAGRPDFENLSTLVKEQS
jgi:predicted dinucleotide-binding enzyme